MTYIEFFDKIATENICACLTYSPDRVIYIGDNSKLMKRHISNYSRVFMDRGQNIEFLYRTVSKNNLDDVVTLLTEIIETYDDCVFDITGGEEIMTLALGVVFSRYPEKKIQIHKFNLRNNSIYDCDKDGVTVYKDTPTLSIEENIRIYGGDIVYGSIDGEATYKWDMNEDFMDDVNLIWNICKTDVRYWNTQIAVFEALNAVGVSTEDGLTITAPRELLDIFLNNRKAKYIKAKGIINYLLKYGLLNSFTDNDENVIVSYKNLQVKKCLSKAGQALEMKVFATAKSVLDNDGVPVYDDSLNGVVIDWDGVLHHKDEKLYDTENEIDVLLMHDIVPVFISCKNGVVTSDELYKLNTVAEHFGGQYSKKVLIATSIDQMGEGGKYLRQRAQDMNIRLLENIQDLEDEELKKKIGKLWTN